MRQLLAPLLIADIWAAPVQGRTDPHQHHRHHPPGQPGAAHGDHSHYVGPAGATNDLRWLDAMVQHHTGTLFMSEFLFHMNSPGVGALAQSI
ncbi:MAG: hypothetical protein AAFX65_13670 [Cyanobacteria bacterium J06638_7]